MIHSINSLFLFSAILLISFTHAVPSHQNLLSQKYPLPRFLKPAHEPRLQQIIKQAQSASCLTNVCFVLDGSNTLTPADFELQGDFVAVTSAVLPIVTPNIALAATQVAGGDDDDDDEDDDDDDDDALIPISNFTTSVDSFLLDVDTSQFANAQRSTLAPGITFCQQQFAQKLGQATKIVVLTDGQGLTTSNIDAPADKICAVGVGNQDTAVLTAIAGGDPTKVLSVNDTAEFLDIVEGLVREVCPN